MKLKRLVLNNFRNYREFNTEFNNRIVYITGLNGQGKTNLIESISVLSLLYSFRTKNYQTLVKENEKNFYISGDFTDSRGRILDVNISFDGTNKKINFMDKKVDKMGDYYGKIPLVYLVPDQAVITTGPPLERRKYIDSFISLVSKDYLNALKNYNQTLKQRNLILSDLKQKKGSSSPYLNVYNSQLIDYGSYIYRKRIEMINILNPILKKTVISIAPDISDAKVIYKSSVLENNYVDDFKKKLERNLYLEIARGSSLIGPHKDELTFEFNSFNLRTYGSKGQHKIFLVSLKLAELEMIKSITKEYPIFLIDDLYSEIDTDKSIQIVSILDRDIQTFITTCDSSKLNHFNTESTQVIEISKGLIINA
ncbi:MAG: DNA replication/repair protein RecF [Candidatus Delongbacteria bacterium]|nr:DNA replication/repair protein RecF [Candidatus Delongbacteria bacterium]MBN2834810.1 DNA replication/repair protein RecF [Candidatus Delongbacteria bacterium]